MADMHEIQQQVCNKYGAAYREPGLDKIVGVADGLRDNRPINGLRHPATDGTEGWYFWSGEWSDDKNFFKPIFKKEPITFSAIQPG